MTCTHAALTRQKLVELGFRFDCLVMEEAAQILEVETFIPMLLQVRGCRMVDRWPTEPLAYACRPRLPPPPKLIQNTKTKHKPTTTRDPPHKTTHTNTLIPTLNTNRRRTRPSRRPA